MPEFTVYSKTTGLIVRIFGCDNEQILQQNLKDDDSFVYGRFEPDRYIFEGGSPVELQSKPDYPCFLDTVSQSWVWDEQASWATLRQERQQRLAASDWTQVPDAPVDRAAWAEYRQALRDLPANTTDPRSPDWPVQPV